MARHRMTRRTLFAALLAPLLAPFDPKPKIPSLTSVGPFVDGIYAPKVAGVPMRWKNRYQVAVPPWVPNEGQARWMRIVCGDHDEAK